MVTLWLLLVAWPAEHDRVALPGVIERTHATVLDVARDPHPRSRAEALLARARARSALAADDHERVQALAGEVEALLQTLAAAGRRLQVPSVNEEDRTRARVRRGGRRVDEHTFDAVAVDTRDHGIIQNRFVGRNSRGRHEIEFRLPTSGAAITQW